MSRDFMLMYKTNQILDWHHANHIVYIHFCQLHFYYSRHVCEIVKISMIIHETW